MISHELHKILFLLLYIFIGFKFSPLASTTTKKAINITNHFVFSFLFSFTSDIINYFVDWLSYISHIAHKQIKSNLKIQNLFICFKTKYAQFSNNKETIIIAIIIIIIIIAIKNIKQI